MKFTSKLWDEIYGRTVRCLVLDPYGDGCVEYEYREPKDVQEAIQGMTRLANEKGFDFYMVIITYGCASTLTHYS